MATDPTTAPVASMSTRAIDSFLEERGFGTIAFGSEEGGYAVPMSFGYDRSNQRCLFQFISHDDSRKQAYLERSNRVSLSVYEWNGIDDWRSVVLHGSLSELPEDEHHAAAVTFAANATPISLGIFPGPANELSFSWHELRISEKTGRRANPVANTLEESPE
ncbi:pyridoxamine 5'-phosphate oxidase family protein [Natrarchaeobius oligotrophus]|uniref:Pyridoxamine 5'-phosphate oxidase family protein n=1 Tax=Natrarchaeobius chitinivorans TaxID=1679083 RepID=A0A3N6M2G1_NATCH|nr:pyridoxamine 5'-phosphate oxidase family protein [Natrarchaeobius chitinivorans]RQG97588.1 hypothetical protein EA472_18795 [Natrarchaeobius chitinivorans]